MVAVSHLTAVSELAVAIQPYP